MIPIISSVAELRQSVATARKQGRVISVVPTMGALHAGHAQLIRHAASDGSFCVTTVYVNPTQFGPKEDFHKYPRQLMEDAKISADAGAAIVFAPDNQTMYPNGYNTYVNIQKLGDHLCGASRPGHFQGVCTVVSKLFNLVLPDIAYFGQKDAQQARILEQMTEDLNFPVSVRILPTVREADGLAMSSRNRYLNAQEREQAPKIYLALLAARDLVHKGENDCTKIKNLLQNQLQSIDGSRLDYVEIVAADTLQPVEKVSVRSLLAVAIFLGTTRLIDNVFLEPPAGLQQG